MRLYGFGTKFQVFKQGEADESEDIGQSGAISRKAATLFPGNPGINKFEKSFILSERSEHQLISGI